MPSIIIPFIVLLSFSLPVTVDSAAFFLSLLKTLLTVVVAVAGVSLGQRGFVILKMADGNIRQFLFGAGLMTLAAIIGTLIIFFAWTLTFQA